MKTKQTIIVIGANGRIGTEIAKGLSKGNYRLLLNDKSSDQVSNVLNEILEANPIADAEISDCSFEGCWEADIIILAIPDSEEEEVAQKIKEVANQKIVVSISDMRGENQTPLAYCEMATGKALQKMLPHSKVIKAFNILSIKKEMLITGTDKEALDTIHELFQIANL